jgi:hypothetical protein
MRTITFVRTSFLAATTSPFCRHSLGRTGTTSQLTMTETSTEVRTIASQNEKADQIPGILHFISLIGLN